MTSLLVRNIVFAKKDQEVKAEELREYFSKYGEVMDVYIPQDYYSQKSRGFCFVEFLKYDDAREALENSDGTEVLGSIVEIVFAREGEETDIKIDGPDLREEDTIAEGKAYTVTLSRDIGIEETLTQAEGKTITHIKNTH